MSRVIADREVCIQAGNCVMAAGEVFDQDDDGVVEILSDDVTGVAAAHAADAVRLCPSGALSLEDR